MYARHAVWCGGHIKLLLLAVFYVEQQIHFMGASILELDLYMRFEMLKLIIKSTVIWDVTPSGLVDRF
jgi:hypothetical protein